jgi:murein DD-endopeptidase MepM/ murein hydrolase activator NlpD
LKRIALAALALVGAGTAEREAPDVRPGTIVRWAADDVEECGMDERTFPPLDGACYYPVDLLRKQGPLELTRRRSGRAETAIVGVAAFDYPVQRLTLPRHMVELSPEDLARVRLENREIARVFGREGPRRFGLPLRPPLDPLPSGGRFGARRIINGLPRSPHSGADFGAPEGTPVLAAADGVVALVGEHFFGGKSVFVDHGDGLITAYMHLLRVDVAPGQDLRHGEPIGAVGATGRATAPHLHFAVRWRRARIDPALLLAPPTEITALP